jgi:hypothetical protein
MITTYLFLQGALFLILVGGFFQVRQFLQMNSTISRPVDLDSFKRLARVNMYVALVYLILAIPTIMFSMYLGFSNGLYGVSIAIAATAPHFILGKFMKKDENSSRSLECSSQFAEEYKQIGLSWRKKILPDF